MPYDVEIKTTKGTIIEEIEELEELEKLLMKYYDIYISAEAKNKKLVLKKDEQKKR